MKLSKKEFLQNGLQSRTNDTDIVEFSVILRHGQHRFLIWLNGAIIMSTSFFPHFKKSVHDIIEERNLHSTVCI
jgi:hypothetical protein